MRLRKVLLGPKGQEDYLELLQFSTKTTKGFARWVGAGSLPCLACPSLENGGLHPGMGGSSAEAPLSSRSWEPELDPRLALS